MSKLSRSLVAKRKSQRPPRREDNEGTEGAPITTESAPITTEGAPSTTEATQPIALLSSGTLLEPLLGREPAPALESDGIAAMDTTPALLDTRGEHPRECGPPEEPVPASTNERAGAFEPALTRARSDAPVTTDADRATDSADAPAPTSIRPRRSARVRLIAGGVVAIALILLFAEARLSSSRPGVAAPAQPPAQPPVGMLALPPAPPATQLAAPPTPPAAPPVGTAEPFAAGTAEAPAATAEPQPGSNEASKLRDEALHLLQTNKNPEAMGAARAAMSADPADAMPYLVLGSALQDLGHWKEASQVYAECAHVAKKGMVDECRAMARRR